MDSSIVLSKEEEFWMVTGVVMRNWTALQIGVNESSDRVEIIKSKISSILQNIIDGISNIKENKCHWSDLADYLGDTINDEFDIVLDDNSDSSVVCHLLQLYDLIEANDRAAIDSAMSKFQDRRHILSGQLYQPQKVVRKEGVSGRSCINASRNACVPPRVSELQSESPSISTSSGGAQLPTLQYSVYQPIGSSAMRNTKLDQPMEEEKENGEMMSDEEGTGSGNAACNGTSGEDNPQPPSQVSSSDEWMVVERRRKRN